MLLLACFTYVFTMGQNIFMTLGFTFIILVNVIILCILHLIAKHDKLYINKLLLFMVGIVVTNHIVSYLMKIDFNTGIQFINFYILNLLFGSLYYVECLTWPIHFRRWSGNESVDQKINRGIGIVVGAPYILSIAIACPLLDVRPIKIDELVLLSFSIIAVTSLTNSIFFIFLRKPQIKTMASVTQVPFSRKQYRYLQIFLISSGFLGLPFELSRGKWLFAVMNLMLYQTNLLIYHSIFRHVSFRGEVESSIENTVSNGIFKFLKHPSRIMIVVLIFYVMLIWVMIFSIN